MADRTEQIILEMEVDTSESVESINALTAANKELRKERNALNLQSEAGKKRAQEINHLIDDNTNKIKTNVSALEKQKINIGNYKSALDGVHPALGKVGEGLQAGTSGFLGMAKAALAFIATPIGAILAGLVAVFTLIKTAITSNNEVFEKFENITNAVGIVIDVLVNRAGKLGEALIALASRDFTGALDKTKEAFSGIADEIERAVGEGQVLLEMTRDLEDAQRQLRIEQAKQENQIKALVVASKNRNISLNEQEGFLRKALKLEQGLVETRTKLAEKSLEIAVRDLANTENINKLKGESYQDFAERLIKIQALSDAQVDPIVEKIEALEQARGSSLAFQEKVENSLAVVQEKRAEALKKQNEALAEQAALEAANRRAQNILPETPTDDPLVGAFQTQANLIDDIDERMKKDLEKRDKEFLAERVARNQKAAEIEVQVERQKVAIIGNLVGSLANLAAEDSEARKVFASAQALINTYLAATAAYASGSEINVFFGVAAAAAAVAAGLANVARINNVEFAEGGYTGPGHKMKPAGIVHAGEVVWSQEDVRRAGGPMAANALRPTSTQGYNGKYMDAGIVTNSISQPINQSFDIQNILKNLPPIEVGVKEITRVQNRIKTKEKISKR